MASEYASGSADYRYFVSGLQPKGYESYGCIGVWKTKENQFPVLSRMALDILSVKLLLVASESAFSTKWMREEVQTCRNQTAQLNALIAEMEAFDDPDEVFDTLMGLRDDVRVKDAKLTGLNDLIA
ncbi:Myb/SANT-like domain-containing protein [Tanacetum coccineum]